MKSSSCNMEKLLKIYTIREIDFMNFEIEFTKLGKTHK